MIHLQQDIDNTALNKTIPGMADLKRHDRPTLNVKVYNYRNEIQLMIKRFTEGQIHKHNDVNRRYGEI